MVLIDLEGCLDPNVGSNRFGGMPRDVPPAAAPGSVAWPWHEAEAGVVSPIPHVSGPDGFDSNGRQPIHALYLGHHARKRLRTKGFPDEVMVAVLCQGLPLCSWNVAHSEERFTFLFRVVTVVTSCSCDGIITVLFKYSFHGFRRRLRTTGQSVAHRPLHPTLFNLANDDSVRHRRRQVSPFAASLTWVLRVGASFALIP